MYETQNIALDDDQIILAIFRINIGIRFTWDEIVALPLIQNCMICK